MNRFKSRELLLIQIVYDWSIQKQTDFYLSPGEYFVFLALGELGKVKVKSEIKSESEVEGEYFVFLA